LDRDQTFTGVSGALFHAVDEEVDEEPIVSDNDVWLHQA
jgi:folate-dependent phosphoribosylglycinamide formyltransferase PurN